MFTIISGKAKQYAEFWTGAKGEGYDWYWDKTSWNHLGGSPLLGGTNRRKKVNKDIIKWGLTQPTRLSYQKCLQLYVFPSSQEKVWWGDATCTGGNGEEIPICEAFLPQDC